MLGFPTRGICRSICVHNVDLQIFCDWIEADVLFDDEELSSSDIVDALMEENVYDNSDMAMQRVDDALTEIRRRHAWIPKTSPFVLKPGRISRCRTWKASSAHSFCLLLSLAQWYTDWAKQLGCNYAEQGELFEELTKESLVRQFQGWQILRTGWSRTSRENLSDIVSRIAGKLGESVGNVERWTTDRAKDGGLDLVCYRPFADKRVGIPVYLVQCASGADWTEKLHTPCLNIWGKIIDWAAAPKTGFATPLAFEDGPFIRNCGLVDGMLLDRYRLLAAGGYRKNWLSSDLRRRLLKWAKPRVAALPRRN